MMLYFLRELHRLLPHLSAAQLPWSAHGLLAGELSQQVVGRGRVLGVALPTQHHLQQRPMLGRRAPNPQLLPSDQLRRGQGQMFERDAHVEGHQDMWLQQVRLNSK